MPSSPSKAFSGSARRLAAGREAPGRNGRSPRRRWLAAAVVGGLLVAACTDRNGAGGEGRAAPAVSTVAIPRVEDLAAIDGAVRRAFEAAVADVEARPLDGDAWGRLGVVYHAHKYVELAVTCYREAIVRAPTSAEWPYLLAVIEQERGSTQAAAEHLRETLARNPGYLAARVRLGDVLLAAGDSEAASQVFSELREGSPRAAWGYIGLGRIALRKGRAAEAVTQLEAAQSLAPENAQVTYLLATALRGDGRREEAAALLHDLEGGVAPVGPPDPYADLVRGGLRNLRAYLEAAKRALEQGAVDDAERLYREVLELAPDHYDAQFNLALMAGRRGDYAAALEWVEGAVASRPEAPQAHYLRAVTLLSLERFDEAVSELRRVVELDPGHQEARALLESVDEP